MQILAPTTDLEFDFEPFVKDELGLFVGPRNQRPQQEICKFFQKGQCRHGDKCQFRHVKADKQVICKHWLKNLCKKGDQCEFLHEFNQKRMPNCWFYATYKECTNQDCIYIHQDGAQKVSYCPWYQRGFCKHGPNCRHNHMKLKPCQRYLTGFCPLGAECELAHVRFEVPMLQEGQEFAVVNGKTIAVDKS